MFGSKIARHALKGTLIFGQIVGHALVPPVFLDHKERALAVNLAY
jgi:hypothetical protein